MGVRNVKIVDCVGEDDRRCCSMENALSIKLVNESIRYPTYGHIEWMPGIYEGNLLAANGII